MVNFHKPIRVTISDPDSGAELESRIVANDYILITAGNRYLKSHQVMGKTHMLAVAVDKTPYVTGAEIRDFVIPDETKGRG